MEMYYLSTVDDRELVEHVAEYLYQHQENLIGKTITYEELTKFLRKSLPDGDIETIYWKRNRADWVQKINDQFIVSKYPCQLKIVHDTGVELLVDKMAVIEKLTKRFTSFGNNIENTADIFDEMRIAFPNARRLFKKASVMLRDARTYAIGMIEQDRSIPLEMKRKMIESLMKSLPPSEELELFV